LVPAPAWGGAQIIWQHGLKESLQPFVDAEDGAIDYGGQHLTVFPEEELIAVFTGWDLLTDAAPGAAPRQLAVRMLPAVKGKGCED
jgi:hypothetical protein